MQFTDTEFEELTKIVEFYRDFNEELYKEADPENLFSKAQLRIFKRFDVVSLKSKVMK
jgi:hypothetical protein